MSATGGGAVGAEASVPATPPPGGGSAPDVLDPGARVELDRIRRRWGELTLARAEAVAPRVWALVDDLGRRTATGQSVPDLGPGVVVDQLAVLVWDAYAAGRGDGLAEQLGALRRDLP